MVLRISVANKPIQIFLTQYFPNIWVKPFSPPLEHILISHECGCLHDNILQIPCYNISAVKCAGRESNQGEEL